MTTIATIAANLEKAKQDLELAHRLATAKERVQRLTKEYEIHKAKADKEKAEARKAEREATFAGLSNLCVSNVTPASGAAGGSLLHQVYKISYKKRSYNSFISADQTLEHSVTGFAALPANVLAFLLDRHPEQLPPEIAALAPGEPGRAVEIYLTAKRRGYFSGPNAGVAG